MDFEMSGGPDELRAVERDDFERLDGEITRLRDLRGLPLGRLLREVRARKLWRGGWPLRIAQRPSFGAYARERAGVTPRYARYLIDYADLADEWNEEPGFPFPPTERHARPLIPLDEAARRAVVGRLGGHR